MRITSASNYDEPRESIATDWANYMIAAFPDSQFVFIPNIENNVESILQNSILMY
jgi:hypothetical protein